MSDKDISLAKALGKKNKKAGKPNGSAPKSESNGNHAPQASMPKEGKAANEVSAKSKPGLLDPPEHLNDGGEAAVDQKNEEQSTKLAPKAETISRLPPSRVDGPKGPAIKQASPTETKAAGAVTEGTVVPDAPVRVAPESDDKNMVKVQQRRLRAEKAKMAKEMKDRAQELLKKSKELAREEIKRVKHEEYIRSVAPHLAENDRIVTPIPPMEAGQKQLHLVEVHPERAFIRLVYDDAKNVHEYQVIEPPLEKDELEIVDFIKDTLVRVLDGRHSVDSDTWEDYLGEKTDQIIVDHSILLDDVSRDRVKYHIIRDFLGYGPIDVLMSDPMIEDISCDGPTIPIFVFHRQYESIKTNIQFHNDLESDAFVIRLAQRSGKHVSVADPILDATLPDGSRLQATLAREVTTRGSSFTVRKFREDPLTPPDLIRYGTMSAEMAAYFWVLMESGSSLIYAGGTASGKTTSLNSVCQFIPPTKKVVSIEDTREINLMHENWIAGLTRSGFGAADSTGRRGGEVDMYKLLEAALRQRPEYMIVGEVRGKEALTLFQAMATGHAVYSTMHADSVSSAVHRLENPPINVPRIMIPIMDAMAVQIQARVDGKLVRRVREITEMVGEDPTTGDLLTNGVFNWDNQEDKHVFTGSSKVLDHYMHLHGLNDMEMEAEMRRRTRILQWMADEDMHAIRDVAAIIQDYYRRPDHVMLMVKNGA